MSTCLFITMKGYISFNWASFELFLYLLVSAFRFQWLLSTERTQQFVFRLLVSAAGFSISQLKQSCVFVSLLVKFGWSYAALKTSEHWTQWSVKWKPAAECPVLQQSEQKLYELLAQSHTFHFTSGITEHFQEGTAAALCCSFFWEELYFLVSVQTGIQRRRFWSPECFKHKTHLKQTFKHVCASLEIDPEVILMTMKQSWQSQPPSSFPLSKRWDFSFGPGSDPRLATKTFRWIQTKQRNPSFLIHKSDEQLENIRG